MPQGKILPPMNKENEIQSETSSVNNNSLVSKKAGLLIIRKTDEEQANTKAKLNDLQLFNGENLKLRKNIGDIKKQNITILQTNNSTESNPLPSFDVFKPPNTSVVQIVNKKSSFKPPLKSVILPKTTPKQSVVADLDAKKLGLSNGAVAFLQVFNFCISCNIF